MSAAERETVTREDIPAFAPCEVALPNGWSARVTVESATDCGAPWDESDGHGPVRRASDARDKRAGERLLTDGTGRYERLGNPHFYDFAEACRIARRDGWGCDCAGPHGSARAQAAHAAEMDFHYLQRWCRGDWEYVTVTVALIDAQGEEAGRDSLGAVESAGEHWRDVAAEMIEEIASGVVLPNCAVGGGQ